MSEAFSGQEYSGGEGFQGQSSGTESQSGGMNPAWNEMLSGIPSEYHSQMIPHLQKWDKGVQDRFNQVHSQYEGYKPFVDQQITPDEINFSLGLLNAINSDPLSVQNALNSWIESEGIGADDGEYEDYGEQGQQDQYDLSNNPDYQRMSQMVDQMAQVLVSQQEEEQQLDADQELEEEFSALHEKFGDFDEQFVLSRMMAGIDGEEAVQEYGNLVNNILTHQRRPGPKLLGPGGTLPENKIDVRKMDGKERRSLVENMLREAAQQGQ